MRRRFDVGVRSEDRRRNTDVGATSVSGRPTSRRFYNLVATSVRRRVPAGLVMGEM